ncbi:MAG: DUF6265 family protein [Flavobacteriales bacterium]
MTRPLFALALFLAACSGTSTPSGSFDFNRLTGRWENTQDRSFRFEEWQPAGEGEFRGRGYILEDGDTTFIEFLRIAKDSSGVMTYFAQGGDPQNPEVIPFRVGKQTADMVEFINPTHSFPTRIVYQFSASDSLTSFVEGPREDGVYRIDFEFIRANGQN